jgi:hypothetical protein
VGLAIATEQVTRLVQRGYHDVEPWPLEVLVGDSPDDLETSGEEV